MVANRQKGAGEDVVEVHTHGSPAVTKAVMSAICKVEGVRPARPGEFTLRAVQVRLLVPWV